MKAIQTRWLLKIGVLAVVCAALPADAIWGTNKRSDISVSLPNYVLNDQASDKLLPTHGRRIKGRTLSESGSGGGAGPAAQKKELNKKEKEEECWEQLRGSPERIKEVYDGIADRLVYETTQVSINCLNLLGQVKKQKKDIYVLFQNVCKMARDEETIALAILSAREEIESLKNDRVLNGQSIEATDGIVKSLIDLCNGLDKKVTSLDGEIDRLRAEVSRLPAQKPASDSVPSASPEGMGGAKEKTTETLEQDKFNKVNRSKIPKKKKSLQKTGDKKSEQEWSEMLERMCTMEHKLECLSGSTVLYEKLQKANVTTAKTVAQMRTSIWGGVQEKIEALQEDIKQLKSQAEGEFTSLQNTFGTYKKAVDKYKGDTDSVYNDINKVLGKFRDNSDSFSKVLGTAKEYSNAAQSSAQQAKENAEKMAEILTQFEEARKNSAEFLSLQNTISVYLENIKNYERDVSEYASWHREELGKRGGDENPERTLKECLVKKTEELQGLDEQYQTVVAKYKQAINDYKDRLEGVNTAAAALEEKQRLLEEKAREANEKLSRLDSAIAGIKTDEELQGQYNELFDQFEKKKDALRTLLERLSMTEEDLVRPHGNGNPSSVDGLDATLLANLQPNATNYLNDSSSIVSTETTSTFGRVGEGEFILWSTKDKISLSDHSVYDRLFVKLANAIDVRQDLTLAQSIVFSERSGEFLKKISLGEDIFGSKDFRKDVRDANKVCKRLGQFRAEKQDNGGHGNMFTPYLGESVCKMLGIL